MPREFSRVSRVSESLRRSIAPLVDETVREAGLGLVSITEIDVSPDFRNATVYVSVFGQQEGRAVVERLQERAAHFRHLIGRELHLKKIPTFKFQLDNSLEQGDKMSQLMRDNKSEE